MEEAWRRLGGNVAEEAMTSARPSDAAPGQAMARRLPARRRRSSRLSLYRCSYFRWKTSRQRAPANAIGTPIRAGKLYPNPIATGMPPRKAPTALPRVNVPRARANSPFFICACAVYVILKNRLQRGPLRENVRGGGKKKIPAAPRMKPREPPLWALTDSNRRPSACKADALNQLS